jgi:rhamnosyltransferase
MSKVAAVVVLYNPELNDLANINSYIDQVEKIFVVDNSDKINEPLFQKVKSLNKVAYISNNGNLGIAAALNIGAKKAITEGFDYLLTMDQDSEASSSLVTTLLKGFSIDSKVALVSPVVYHRNGKEIIKKPGKSFEQVITNWTSGSLLDLHIFKNTGGFKEELFIDYVDHEFCLRLNKMGYKIFICNNTFLKHSLGKVEEINLFFRKVYPTNHSAIRLYYRARNRFYVKKIYKKILPVFFKQDDIEFWKGFLKAILFERSKLEKIKYFLWGYLDYRKNKFGKFDIRRVK